jgi:PleD family two-component response regulator
MQAPEGDEALPGDLTFSAGIAEAPSQGTTIDGLMIAADRLLYKAKNDGRARIEAATEMPRAPFSTSLAAREPIDQ